MHILHFSEMMIAKKHPDPFKNICFTDEYTLKKLLLLRIKIRLLYGTNGNQNLKTSKFLWICLKTQWRRRWFFKRWEKFRHHRNRHNPSRNCEIFVEGVFYMEKTGTNIHSQGRIRNRKPYHRNQRRFCYATEDDEDKYMMSRN